jgi:sterol desaturase/sphingolipid hydroxylase (fatty acid hydroxylase superfamily)
MFILNFLASVLCYDIWFYLSHLLLHLREFYPYHKLHHYSAKPVFYDAYVAHTYENSVQGAGAVFPMLIFEFSYIDIGAVMAFIAIRGAAQHDERCSWLIGNHHLLHHKYGKNCYGQYWLDWIGGTLHPNKEEYKYGLLYT